MERKVLGLIAASTLLVGILLWSKEDAARPVPLYSPTTDIKTACAFQEELWCGVTLPEDPTREERRQCAIEFFPPCVSCLYAIEHARRTGTLNGLPQDGCRALKNWRRNHPGPDPSPWPGQLEDDRRQ